MSRILPLLLALTLSSPVLARPVLRHSGKTVSVEGVSPGAAVAVFSVANEPDGSAVPFPIRTRQAVLLQDDDRNGTVAFDRERVVPAVGIWIAVDLATGQWVVGGGPGFDPVPLQLTDVAKKDNAGQLRKLSADLGEVEVMVVRPGTGAWELYVAKSSKADESRGAEDLRLDVGSMRPIGNSPASPNALKQGDIVAVIDPYMMRYFVTEVGK
jgi:hypothetical protein